MQSLSRIDTMKLVIFGLLVSTKPLAIILLQYLFLHELVFLALFKIVFYKCMCYIGDPVINLSYDGLSLIL